MKEDPWKPHSNEAYEGKAGDMLNFARARIAFVKCELERGAGDTAAGPVSQNEKSSSLFIFNFSFLLLRQQAVNSKHGNQYEPTQSDQDEHGAAVVLTQLSHSDDRSRHREKRR